MYTLEIKRVSAHLLWKDNKLCPTYGGNNSASKEEGTSQVPVTDLSSCVS